MLRVDNCVKLEASNEDWFFIVELVMEFVLADVLKNQVALLGYRDLKQCALDLDLPYELLRKVISEGHLPKEKTLMLYADKLGISAQLLLETVYRQRSPVPLHGLRGNLASRNATGVSTVDATGVSTVDAKQHLAPVLGYAACGAWLESEAITPEQYAPIDISDPDAFFVIAEGDSMIGANIPEKARLLVSPAMGARNGDIVLAKNLSGEYTVKKLFRKSDGSAILQPLNPAYEPLFIPAHHPLSVFRIVEIRIAI